MSTGEVCPLDALDGEAGPLPVAFSPAGRGRLIRLFSRVGLWGVAAGLVPVAADILTSTWLWGFGSVVTELGFIIGGGSIVAASILMLKEVGLGLRPVKLAALAGVPLGLTLLMMGSFLLLEPVLPPTLRMVQLFMLGLPTAVVLGVLVMVLLIVGFALDLFSPPPRPSPRP